MSGRWTSAPRRILSGYSDPPARSRCPRGTRPIPMHLQILPSGPCLPRGCRDARHQLPNRRDRPGISRRISGASGTDLYSPQYNLRVWDDREVDGRIWRHGHRGLLDRSLCHHLGTRHARGHPSTDEQQCASLEDL